MEKNRNLLQTCLKFNTGHLQFYNLSGRVHLEYNIPQDLPVCHFRTLVIVELHSGPVLVFRKELVELWESHHQLTDHASQQAHLIQQLRTLQADTQKSRLLLLSLNPGFGQCCI